MSDETKAGIIAVSWLTVFAVFCVEPSVIKALLLIFVTVVELLYIKHDAEREELRKSRERYLAHAGEEIRRNTAELADELPEERVKRILGGFR